MKAVRDTNGNVRSADDTENTASSSTLRSPVTINKAGSSNFGKLADIVNVRNNKVVVQLSGTDKYGTYNFDQLANS